MREERNVLWLEMTPGERASHAKDIVGRVHVVLMLGNTT